MERDEVYGEGGDDVVRGGANDDVVHGDYMYATGSTDRKIGDGPIVPGLVGDEGIDQVYGDEGSDFLFGDAGRFNSATGVWEQRGQRLWGGDGVDFMYAFANVGVTATDAQITAETQLWGDEMHGGAGNDWMYGNLRRDVIFGDSGNEYISGDYLAGPTLVRNEFANTIGMDRIEKRHRASADWLLGEMTKRGAESWTSPDAALRCGIATVNVPPMQTATMCTASISRRRAAA